MLDENPFQNFNSPILTEVYLNVTISIDRGVSKMQHKRI